MITKFKLLESKNENLEIIATNNSHFSWEYDSYNVDAFILLNKEDNTLYLKITRTNIKTGLGAGKTKKELEYVNIGTLYKAELAKVRTLLKKHQLQDNKFSRHWEDEEGNKMSLTDIIKLNKPVKSIKPKMKHIKPIDNFNDIEIVKYSERSYAIFGEGTKEIKDKLKEIGCKYNKFLKDPKTGERRAGWICSNYKIDKVKKLITF
jgi:hypothetical protein